VTIGILRNLGRVLGDLSGLVFEWIKSVKRMKLTTTSAPCCNAACSGYAVNHGIDMLSMR
jgi:hypothetical protein